MSEKELRELDAWIARNAMNWQEVKKLGEIEKAGQFCIQGEDVYIHDRGNYIKTFQPTQKHGDAMMVLEKCYKHSNLMIGEDDRGVMVAQINGKRFFAQDLTLPLAICLFAKKLFSK